MTHFNRDWILAALTRAIRTMAQTALATIGGSALMSEVNWALVGSAALLSGILCILMALAGLPEAVTDGTLIVDDSGQERTNYIFQVETPLDEIAEKKSVRLNVETVKAPESV